MTSPQPLESPMTVCIAAIANDTSVIGASDRLLTAGDMQFQPDTPKVKTLTNSIVAMTAGDAWLQSEIMGLLSRDVSAAIATDPETWLEVRWVADWYCGHWGAIKRARAERHILSPLGLTTESFLTAQGSMNDKTVQELSNALIGFAMPTTACLVAGVDPTGPHIFGIVDGALMQADSVGFAAIGSGARHAESQLMLAKYAPSTPIAAAVPLIHLAKSRAEVAPGVGVDTDMFLIGQLGSYSVVPDHVLEYLGSQVASLRADEDAALVQAQQGLVSYMESLSLEPEKQEADPEEQRPLGDNSDGLNAAD